ncbi:MAG: carbon storage regulator [Planctomycetota bacterium]
MLVLSRKSGERIHIGDNITVEVRRVAGNRVTLALHAPRDVRILRGELKEAAESFETEPEAPAGTSSETFSIVKLPTASIAAASA